jgi:hypothetical protein
MQLLEWVSVLDATDRLRAVSWAGEKGQLTAAPLKNCGGRRMDYRGP